MSNVKAQQLTRLLETAAKQSPQKTIIYTIKRGDTLSRIISKHYKVAPNTLHHRVAEASILAFNRHIKHPDHIHYGAAIRLMPLPNTTIAGRCLAPVSYSKPKHQWATGHRLEPMSNDRSARIRDSMPKREQEQAAFSLLSSLENNHDIITASIGGGVNAFGNLVGQGNSEVIREITAIYEEYKAGNMTQNQYNYRRQKVLKDLSHRMGALLNREGLRIDRRKGLIPTNKIEKHAKRIAKLSRYASKGGVVLAGAGVAMSCRDIANTDNQQEKNEILVETTASTIIGLSTSAILTVALISNPVGWGIAVVLGVGAAAASFGAGKYARHIYTIREEKIDFASLTGVDKICQ